MGKVTARKETIKSAVLLFFEIDCGLLVSLPPSSYSISSDENWDSFCKRYNLKDQHSLFGSKFIEDISEKLRKEAGIDFTELKDNLTDHLTNRLEEAMEMVEFVQSGLRKPIDSKEEALKHIQWNQSGKAFKFAFSENEFEKFNPKFTLKNFEQWKAQINVLEDCPDKLNLFKAFSSIEESFESIETQINQEAGQLDAAIQMETDRLRGK